MFSDKTEVFSDFDLPYFVNTSISTATCNASDHSVLPSDFLIEPCFQWCTVTTDDVAWILLDLQEMFYISGMHMIHDSAIAIQEFLTEYSLTDPDTWMTYSSEMIVEVQIFIQFIC